VAFDEGVGAHPVEEILSGIPDGENYVWIAVVDGAEELVGDEAGHLVHESGTFAESLLEGVGVFLFDVDTIGDGYHLRISLCLATFIECFAEPYGDVFQAIRVNLMSHRVLAICQLQRQCLQRLSYGAAFLDWQHWVVDAVCD
jgi:hypothetical protein